MKRIEREVVERAYNICKRYERLSARYLTRNFDKWSDLQSKKYKWTNAMFDRKGDLSFFETSLLYYATVAAVDNNKTKDALVDALHILGFEIN